MKNKIKLLKIIILFIIILVVIVLLLNKCSMGNEIAAIKLYEDLIDITVTENLIDSDDFLAIYVDNVFDPLNKELLSNDAKVEILNYSKKYNFNIYNMNKEEVFLLKNDNENQNGSCISFNFSSISYKKAIVNVYYYIDNQSSGMQTYVLKYVKKEWEIVKTNSQVIS